jgi:hypothetical protein
MGGQGDPIFVESFENGYGQWQNQNDGLDLLFNGTPGAVGTARCGFVETSGASSGERPHHSFSPPVTPTNMEWWARPSSATPGTGNLALSSGTTGNADILEQNFSALAPIRFTATDGTTRINVDSTKARVANAWYHFELRNIDWRGRSYDYYLDGTLQKAGLPLPNVAGISRIDLNGGLFSTSSIVGTCFDEIVFR